MRHLIAALVVATSSFAWADGAMARSYTPSTRAMPTPDVMAKQPQLRSNMHGWFNDSEQPGHYEVRCDTVYSSCELPVLRSRPGVEADDLALVAHSESAEAWRGRTIRVRVEMKAGHVDGWLGAFIRVDDAKGQRIAFEDMSNRPVRGTSGFEWYSVELQVPNDAERITLGTALHGAGAVIIREVKLTAS